MRTLLYFSLVIIGLSSTVTLAQKKSQTMTSIVQIINSCRVSASVTTADTLTPELAPPLVKVKCSSGSSWQLKYSKEFATPSQGTHQPMQDIAFVTLEL